MSESQTQERRLVFETVLPVDLDTIKKNVDYATSLNLPEADCGPIPMLKIIANGPSALGADLSGETLAINNALNLWFNTGRSPTYWLGCDPQEGVAEFLQYAPHDTTYLVASKCHPEVFKTLKDRDIRLWHVDDFPMDPRLRAVQTAGTATLTAFRLMRSLGWRRFETWGWDGCYMDGRSHAVTQAHNADDMTVVIKDETYATTAPWMAEANEAVRQLSAADYDVVINGGGMTGAIFDMIGIPSVTIPDQFKKAALIG